MPGTGTMGSRSPRRLVGVTEYAGPSNTADIAEPWRPFNLQGRSAPAETATAQDVGFFVPVVGGLLAFLGGFFFGATSDDTPTPPPRTTPEQARAEFVTDLARGGAVSGVAIGAWWLARRLPR